MSQILVRNLDPQTIKHLKERAQQNGRSLEAEVREILEDLADRARKREEFRRLAAEIRGRSGPQTTDSVDLIREDRER